MFINTLFDLYNNIKEKFDWSSNVVSTNLVSNDISTKMPIVLSYNINGVSYSTPFLLPFRNKTFNISILSASLTDHIYEGDDDITAFVLSKAGPFHNFFMNPMVVRDLINCSDDDFESLSIMYVLNGEILTRTYTDINTPVLFHYGLEWGSYLQTEYSSVRKTLAYLDLQFP
jgi:hypothetical protein